LLEHHQAKAVRYVAYVDLANVDGHQGACALLQWEGNKWAAESFSGCWVCRFR